MPIYADKKAGKPTGRWRVEVSLDGFRKRGRFDTMTEAKVAEADWRKELRAGPPKEATSVPTTTPKYLSQLLAKAAPMLWEAGSSHYVLSVGKVEKLIGWLGDPLLASLGTFADDAVTRLRKEGKADATVNRYLSALHAILKWGHKRKLLPELPEFQWLDEGEGRIRWLTQDEERDMLAALHALGHAEVADFVAVAIDTGCRLSELLYAKPKQQAGKWLHLWETKSGEPRSVPLTQRAEAILSARLPWTVSERQLRWAWNKAKLAIGLRDDEDFVIHACRHTRATRMVQAGVNLRIIQKFLGHKRIETTLRYAHVSDDMLSSVVSIIEQEHPPEGEAAGGAPRVGHGASDERSTAAPVEVMPHRRAVEAV